MCPPALISPNVLISPVPLYIEHFEVQVSTAVGGAGGSGIVILRYADTKPAATSTTGSPTITTSGGYRIYQFTASGSITF